MPLYFTVFQPSFCKYLILPYTPFMLSYSIILPSQNYDYQRDNWTLPPRAVVHADSYLLAQRLFLPSPRSPEVYFYSSVILVSGLKAYFFLLQKELGLSIQYTIKLEVVQVNMKEHFT